MERCCILVAAASAAADEDEIIDIVLLALMGLQVAMSNEVAAVVINAMAIANQDMVGFMNGRFALGFLASIKQTTF